MLGGRARLVPEQQARARRASSPPSSRAEDLQRSASREAENLKRQQIVEARDQILKEKTKADSDLRSRKGQVAKRERDLKQLQDGIAEMRGGKPAAARGHRRDWSATSPRAKPALLKDREVLEQLVREENARLEHASGMTRDEARRQLLANLKAEARFEAAQLVKEIKDEAQRGAEAEATKIVALAMERIASDLSAERTVTRFALPAGGQMRGRIIGHEGKNIKAFEQVTGIQILLDESGESLQLSGFNPGEARDRPACPRNAAQGREHPSAPHRRADAPPSATARRRDEEGRRADA